MSNDTISTVPPAEKLKKKKSLIRTEAVVPFLIVAVITFCYFHFLFDHNLKSALQYLGYEVVGAEVDIQKLETNFWNASFHAQGIEITNSEKPTFDAIKIGDVRYSLLWDGLLRARFIVNEMAVEQIEFNSPRAQAGKVKPPPPPPTPKPKSSSPGQMDKEVDRLKDSAVDEVADEESDNALGDVASLLKGGVGSKDLVDAEFPSKKKLEEFQKSLDEKQKKWNDKLKTLPQAPEIKALGDRIAKVKTSGFKNPQEIQKSLEEVQSIFKDADGKIKSIQGLSDDFNKDYKEIDANYKEIDALVKADIIHLQSKLKIPKIDAKSLSKAIFMSYLRPYLRTFYKYQKLAEKYGVKPDFSKKQNSASESTGDIKPHPRAKGVSYEFGKPHAYPWVWIKKISISSQAGLSKESGQISGLITNVTSNQTLTGLPTELQIKGDFPGLEISGFSASSLFDDRHSPSLLTFNSEVGSYLLHDKELLHTPDVQVGFKTANGHLKIDGKWTSFTDLDFNLSNDFQKVDYAVNAKNDVISEVLKNTFAGLPSITLQAKAEGKLPAPNIAVDSNFGSELQKGLEKQVQKKIDEAKQKLQALIDSAIGKQKADVDSKIKGLQYQVQGATKKASDEMNTEKNQAQTKMNQSQKGAAGDATQKAIDEGKKALDKLKGSFGL